MYGARAQDIAAANGLRSAKRLARGHRADHPHRHRAGAPARRARAEATAVSNVSRTAPRATDARVRVNYQHPVAATPWSAIATRYKTTVRQLLAWNKGLRASRLPPGTC